MTRNANVVRCNGCSYRYLTTFNPITLKCRIGSEIATYPSTTAWCNQCESLRYVEFIPDFDKSQPEYIKLVKLVSEAVLTKKGQCKRNIRRLKSQITWREERKAPPHCLSCGTADITPVDFEKTSDNVSISKNFRHSCGGSLVIDYNGASQIRFVSEADVVWMDIEGNVLDNSPASSRRPPSLHLHWSIKLFLDCEAENPQQVARRRRHFAD